MAIYTNRNEIDEEFSNMLSTAEDYFDGYTGDTYKYHQVLVILTNDGKEDIFSSKANSVNELVQVIHKTLDSLQEKGETSLKKMICMWNSKGLDALPYRFLKKLCQIDEANKATRTLLEMGNGYYITRSLEQILG